jgi:hypothetical protein
LVVLSAAVGLVAVLMRRRKWTMHSKEGYLLLLWLGI